MSSTSSVSSQFDMSSTSSMSEMTVIESYDENLCQNVFLMQLQDRYPQLHETTANNRWMICVPRSGSSGQHEFKEQDFLNHILIQLDHKPGTYKTLSDKEVDIENNVIHVRTRKGFPEERIVPILFEETFFNLNDESYRVVCINQMLEGGPTIKSAEQDLREPAILHSLSDCVELLWGRPDSRHSQKHVDELIEVFNRTSTSLEGESLQHLVTASKSLFTRALQLVLKDSALKKLAKNNKLYMDNVKLAVETYVMHGVYRKLFKHISASVASQDSHLNKTTRNLAELQLKDLHVRAEFFQNIPRARRELCNLNRYSTPMGKLNCFRRVIKTLMKPPRKGLHEEEGVPLTTDDLLPILVFLVVKAGTANWCANFTYMTHCRFSKSSNDDEFGFYLASLEAAIEHVSSGQLGKVDLAEEHHKQHEQVDVLMSPGTGSLWQQQDSDNTNIEHLFQYVVQNNISGVEEMLSKKPPAWSDVQSQLCHPLCVCDKCEKISRAATDSTMITTNSQDDRGFAVLHMAAAYGHTKMSDFLIGVGAEVNATDYQGQSPLHVSCQKGHQGVTLLLLHHRSDVNLQDNEDNTPLHLAASNGHEDCVKALIYYNPSSTTLSVDARNDVGDTSLHLAAKWGYENIVEILLENGASPELRNRKNQSPLHCAHNLKVARLIDQALNRRQALHDLHVSLTNLKSDSTLSKSSSTPDLRKGVNAPYTVPRSPSITAISPVAPVPKPVTHSKNKHYKQRLTEKEKKMEKLLKSVADGDIQMVKFQLGWYEEDIEEELGGQNLSLSDLCHPLCQCEKCQPVQKLTQVTTTGLHINSRNAEGLTVLHVAAMHGHEVLMELFLKRGAFVNEGNSTQQCTALHFACQNNKPRIVSLLVQHKAKVNAKNIHGNTPLHYCCLSASHACAEILLKNGANVNQTNYKGNTPLHEAARWNLVLMTQLLVHHGALVNLRNQQQLTSVQLARNDRILKILCQAGLSQTKRKSMRKSSRREKKGASSLKGSHSVSNEGPKSLNEDSIVESQSVQDLFASFEEEDLQQMQHLTHSIQSFDSHRSLRHIVTRDRSAPRLDKQLLHLLSIQNFNHDHLRHTRTTVTTYPVVILRDDQPIQEMDCFPNLYSRMESNKRDSFPEIPSVKDPKDAKMYSMSSTCTPIPDEVQPKSIDSFHLAPDYFSDTGEITEFKTFDSDFNDKDLISIECLNNTMDGGRESESEHDSENSNTESHEDWAEITQES